MPPTSTAGGRPSVVVGDGEVGAGGVVEVEVDVAQVEAVGVGLGDDLHLGALAVDRLVEPEHASGEGAAGRREPVPGGRARVEGRVGADPERELVGVGLGRRPSAASTSPTSSPASPRSWRNPSWVCQWSSQGRSSTWRSSPTSSS